MNLDSILLAMLREPTSGYDLKAEFDASVNHFWPAELSQIYRTLKRLEGQGYLRSRTEPSDRGPDRKVYHLTASGRRALRRRLEADPHFAEERIGYIAQLFFLHELDDLEVTRSYIGKLRDRRAQQLEDYRAIMKSERAKYGGSMDDATDEQFHRYLTLDAGINVMKARLRWCDRAIKRIDERIAEKNASQDRNKSRQTTGEAKE